MPTVDGNQVERKWFILDAAGKSLGETAAAAVTLVLGKHKPEYASGEDCGDCVIIINAKDAQITGSAEERQYYHDECGWISGMIENKYRQLMQSDRPEEAVIQAIKDMLPNSGPERKAINRVTVHR